MRKVFSVFNSRSVGTIANLLHEQGAEDDDDVSEAEDEAPYRRRSVRVGPGALMSVDANAVFLVLVVNFLDSLGGSISTPILPFYAREFHATYADVGELFSAFALAQMGSMPLLSYCSDRYGRRSVLLIATLGTAVGSFWQATASTFTSLLVSRVFSGFWSGVASVCQVYIVDVVPTELRADYISYLNSSTQASVLFGPSIGAGLSYLGLTAPLYVQGCVNILLFMIVLVHLPESPEWLRVHGLLRRSSMTYSDAAARARQSEMLRQVGGLGTSTTLVIVCAFGLLMFCGMVSQMSILSMFALYAGNVYGLDSVHVGFTMTLGALSSVGTNIYLSPFLLHRLGERKSSLVGFLFIFVGSAMVAVPPLPVSILGFMLAYQGLAINSSAVATGAANMTDPTNRATIMTGSRMFKSLGAVIGPIIAGRAAVYDTRWPFFAAACFALGGLFVEVVSVPVMRRIGDLLEHRRTVGHRTPFLEGRWVDEYGTRDEVWDLGLFVSELLTQRHYRWVTYNQELKNFISDSFPEISTASEEAHRRAYDSRRRLVRLGVELTYEELLNQFNEVKRENEMLKVMMVRQNEDDRPTTVQRRRSKSQQRTQSVDKWEEEHTKHANILFMTPGVSGFGGT